MTLHAPVHPAYCSKEEIANSVSHGFGVLFGVFALVLLILKANALDADFLTFASYIVYGVSIILLYLASTLYHAISFEKTKRALKTLDHCAIYLLIAGSYTPFMLVTLRTPLSIGVLAALWGMALLGIVLKIAFVYRFKVLSLSVYLIMGWISMLLIYPLEEALPRPGFVLLILGGCVYSLGVVFYVKRSIPYGHAIWHLFVLGGTVLHFCAIYFYVPPV